MADEKDKNENDTLDNSEIKIEDILEKGSNYKPSQAQVEKLKAKLFDTEKKNDYFRKKIEEYEAQRQPGTTVIDPEGNQLRKKRANSTGLSDKILPPFTKGRTAIYKALSIDEINPATGLPIEPYPVLIPGTYALYDKFEEDPNRRNKLRENVVRTKRVVKDGKPTVENEVEDVLFERGWLHVDVEKQWPLYVFLELHPMNKSNRHRPTNAVAGFERVDVNYKSKASQAIAADLALEAGIVVRKLEKNEVYAFAAQVNPPIPYGNNRPVFEVKDDLLRWAMANPITFFQMNGDSKAGIQIHVYDALNFGVLDYRPDSKSYVTVDDDQVVHTHTAAETPMESLVKALAKPENKDKYEKIRHSLEYWESEQ